MTTNQGRFFSNGLVLQWIPQNPDISSSTLRFRFETLLASIVRPRVPTIAAPCGHAAAKGFMLVLTQDYRVIKEHRPVLFMRELDNALKFTKGFTVVIWSKLMPGPLKNVVLGACKCNAQMDLEGGIVVFVCADPPQTLEAAIKRAQKLEGRSWKKEIYSELGEKVTVANGDKEGFLSLGDANCEEEPHSSPVSGIATTPFSMEKICKEKQMPVHSASFQIQIVLLSGKTLLQWVCSSDLV